MMVQLTAEDGHTFECWRVPAEGARRGGVVIVQEVFGVTDQLKGVARRYAALGYEVMIPALFDRVQRGVVVGFDEIDKARALMGAADPAKALTDIAATVAALAAGGGKVAVIGFCWGGGLALRTAQILDIAGAVSFYGTRLGTWLDRPLRAPVEGHFGAEDDHTPPQLLAEVAAYLGPDFKAFTYPAGHAFANDERPSYVPEAAEAAHARTAAFLAAHVG
jgi:carboxymethylenebutenolidase